MDRWTKHPTEPGYYWMDRDGEVHHDDPDLVELLDGMAGLYVWIPGGNHGSRPLSEFESYYFYGPVEVERAPAFPGYDQVAKLDGDEL